MAKSFFFLRSSLSSRINNVQTDPPCKKCARQERKVRSYVDWWTCLRKLAMDARTTAAQTMIRLVSVHSSMLVMPAWQEMAGDQPSRRSALPMAAMKQSWSLARREVGV